MIVTKKQLVQNWINEFKSHTSITPAIVDSNRNTNYYSFISPAAVVLTHFEAVVSEVERIKLFLSTRNVAIIIDESAKLKNPNTKLTQTFFELSQYFKKRVIMTGTPVANRPYDIWSQVFFLDQGKSLGHEYEDFKKQTDLSNKLFSDSERQIQFENSVSDIYRKISSFSVRETKNSGIIHLPQKVYVREEAEFNDAQLDLYERIRKELMVEVLKNGELIIDDSSFVIKRLLRLVQVASNPRLVDESYRGKSAKESILNNLITKITNAGEKCIVWTNYIENVDSFCKEYSDIGSVKIHGGMKITDRNRSVERFKNNNIKVLFATPASAKEGLTLTMANHVIFYDRGFSLDDYLQAQDRIHRIFVINNMLKTQKKLGLNYFQFDLIRTYYLFKNAGALREIDKSEVIKAIKNLDERKVRSVLAGRFKVFKGMLIKQAIDEGPGANYVISQINQQLNNFCKQISLFEDYE